MAFFPITISFSLLIIFHLFGTSQGLVGSCLTNYTLTINNQTHLIDDPYRTNLLSLFANFTTSSSTFYNTTAGDPPNKAYGLYLCRGDTGTDTCRTCVASLTDWVDDGCKEGVAFDDKCMIHYANYSFFGKANDEVLGAVEGKFVETRTLSLAYNQTLDAVLEGVITDAASSATLYATREGVVNDGQGGHETVYGLAQCTPDIDRSGCRGCLKAAQSYLQPNLTGAIKFCWALLPSCQLRYDNASFFGVGPAKSAPPTVLAFLVATLILFVI